MASDEGRLGERADDEHVNVQGPVVEPPAPEAEQATGSDFGRTVGDSLRAGVDAAKNLGLDLNKFSSEQLLDLAQSAREHRVLVAKDDAERQAEAKRREYQANLQHEAEKSKAELQELAERRTARRESLEAYARVFLAAALVLGSIGGVLVGVLGEVPAEELTQILAPISGLAGIAIGYFFGRGSRE